MPCTRASTPSVRQQPHTPMHEHIHPCRHQYRPMLAPVPSCWEGWRCKAVHPNTTDTDPQEPPPPSPTLPATPPPDPPSPPTLPPLPPLLVNLPAGRYNANLPGGRYTRARVCKRTRRVARVRVATMGIESHAHKWTAPTGLAALTTHVSTQAASACNTHTRRTACRQPRALPFLLSDLREQQS